MKKLFVLSTLLLSNLALAENFDYTGKWGIGGSLGYNTPIFGHNFNTAADGGETWGGHVRYHLCKSCGLEAAFTKHEYSDTKTALQVTDILFFKRLSPTSRFTPVIGAGAGVVDISHTNENNLKLGVKLRGGAEYALNNNFSLGLNVDYQHVNKMVFADNLDGRNIHALAARVGLTYYFGKSSSQEITKTATGTVVKATEKDTDNDGVVDSKDKCPNTVAETKVNAYGCAEAEKASVHLNVRFDSGKSTITSGYDDDLKDLAAFMTDHPETKIEIQGHTDSSGSKALNKKLSQLRADSVKDTLTSKFGAEASRITAVGYGDEEPIADNKNEAGRQQNRRVIAVIK